MLRSLFSIFFLPADYVLGEDVLPCRQALFSKPGAQHQLGLVDQLGPLLLDDDVDGVLDDLVAVGHFSYDEIQKYYTGDHHDDPPDYPINVILEHRQVFAFVEIEVTSGDTDDGDEVR